MPLLPRPTRPLLAVPVVLAGLALGACGSSSSSGSAPAASGSGAGAGGQAITAFRSCLARHGVTLKAPTGRGARPPGQTDGQPPTPTAGARPPTSTAGGPPTGAPGGRGRRGGGLFGLDPSDPKTQAALTACRSTLPQGFGGGQGGPGGAPAPGGAGAGAPPATTTTSSPAT